MTKEEYCDFCYEKERFPTLKQENEQLAKRICELQSDLSKAKSQIEKMKNCSNYNGIIKGGLSNERCKICIKDTTFGFWELAE